MSSSESDSFDLKSELKAQSREQLLEILLALCSNHGDVASEVAANLRVKRPRRSAPIDAPSAFAAATSLAAVLATSERLARRAHDAVQLTAVLDAMLARASALTRGAPLEQDVVDGVAELETQLALMPDRGEARAHVERIVGAHRSVLGDEGADGLLEAVAE